jgi:hypothetical protein
MLILLRDYGQPPLILSSPNPRRSLPNNCGHPANLSELTPVLQNRCPAASPHRPSAASANTLALELHFKIYIPPVLPSLSSKTRRAPLPSHPVDPPNATSTLLPPLSPQPPLHLPDPDRDPHGPRNAHFPPRTSPSCRPQHGPRPQSLSQP